MTNFDVKLYLETNFTIKNQFLW